jgi:hypothetical protein
MLARPAPVPAPPVVDVWVAPNDHVSAGNIPVPAEVVQVKPSTVTTMLDLWLKPRFCPFSAKAAACNRIPTVTNKVSFFIANNPPER